MCSNYEPVTDQDLLMRHFGISRPGDVAPPEEVWPTGYAQFVVRPEDRAEAVGLVEREGQFGQYGLLPHWADNTAFGRKTYNCRSETAASKPSFREAWNKGRRCIIPSRRLFEPNWETGQAIRWAISRVDDIPMGVAGLWNMWVDPRTGERVPTFTMLTVNADDHVLYRRFHRPGEEKRMPVILEEADYDAWLACTVDQAMSFMKQFPAERLQAEPAPLIRASKKDKITPLPKASDFDDLDQNGQLF